MKLLPDLSAFDWISKGVSERGPGSNPTVAHCLPPVFASYAKILHSIHEDASIRDRRLTWQEAEARDAPVRGSETGVEKAIADLLGRSTLVYGGAGPGARLQRMRWAELAPRLGIPFTPLLSAASFTRLFPGGSWPRHLVGPMEGSLTDEERDALTSVLRGRTSADRAFFRFWFLATTRWDEDKLFVGTLAEACLFPDEALGVRSTPTHWYPEDRSWVVCSDYDLTFSLVGGTEELIRGVLDHPDLECVRVSSTTRVDVRADAGEAAR